MQKYNENIKGEELHAILDEIDTNQNGQVELDEYLQVIGFLKMFIFSKIHSGPEN